MADGDDLVIGENNQAMSTLELERPAPHKIWCYEGTPFGNPQESEFFTESIPGKRCVTRQRRVSGRVEESTWPTEMTW